MNRNEAWGMDHVWWCTQQGCPLRSNCLSQQIQVHSFKQNAQYSCQSHKPNTSHSIKYLQHMNEMLQSRSLILTLSARFQKLDEQIKSISRSSFKLKFNLTELLVHARYERSVESRHTYIVDFK